MALTVCLVALAVLCGLWFLKTRELRYLQPNFAHYQQRELILNQLVAEVVLYSEKNAAIDPILIGIGLKQPKGATPPTTATPKK